MQDSEIEIRGRVFRVQVPNVKKSRPFLLKMTQKLASTGAQINMEGLISLLGAVDEKICNEAVDLFTPFTSYEEDGRFVNLQANPAFWDLQGKYGLGDQAEWLAFCIKETYSDFLERIVKIFSKTPTQ